MSKSMTYNAKATFVVSESGVKPVPGAKVLRAKCGTVTLTVAMHQRRRLAGGVATEVVNGKTIYRWLTKEAARRLYTAGKEVLA